MLTVTGELVPGGRESARRTLAIAKIANRGGASIANYQVEVVDEIRRVYVATLNDYPRWSATLWDLVLRCVAQAIYREEQLPARSRPVAESVPVYDDGARYTYIRMADMSEPARTEFSRRMRHSTVPAAGFAYLHDWFDFLNGNR